MRKILSLIGALGALLFSIYPAPPSRGASGISSFSRSGLEGSGRAVMQSVTVPARVARVVTRPGSGGAEVWAAGRSVARHDGWSRSASGQVVFLKYTPQTGWELSGPPTEPDGRIINPEISEFALSSTGEGWAVGQGALLLRKAPGDDRWIKHPASGTGGNDLLSVSLTVADGLTKGFAVGSGSTILRNTGDGNWQVDPQAPEMVADGSPPLISVAAISQDEAWAVSGESDTRSLRIYRRTGSGWSRFVLSEPFFEGPFPALGTGGAYNQEAVGASIAAYGNTVFVGGRMLPADVAVAGPAEREADDQRPFVIRIRGSEVKTYCPNRYRLQARSGDFVPDTASLCDEPLPVSAYDILSISMVSETEAFAGGLGFFHYKEDDSAQGWFREPDTNGYLASVSMSSPTEGWVANTGGRNRGTGMRASSTLLGHWTTKPTKPSIARWPQTQQQTLEAVALSPDGSGAIAVGGKGSAIQFTRQIGWDKTPIAGTQANFHAVAWPGSSAWVVGDRGVILNYANGRWIEDPASERLTRKGLFSLAFRSASEGIAVGATGTILRYSGSAWSVDEKVTESNLYAVTTTRTGYLAVGDHGTVLEYKVGGWVKHEETAQLLGRPQGVPHLYAAATLPSGAMVVGGQSGALLRADAGGEFRQMDPPIEGTVVALAASTSGPDRLLASVSSDLRKYDGPNPAVMRGGVLAMSDGRWRDVSLNRRVTMANGFTDSSSFDDPVLGIATKDGITGWGAGGTPANVQDGELHIRSEPTGAVYRMDLSADPKTRDSSAVPVFDDLVNFAVFGESWCEKGACGASVGTGTMADLVSVKIRDEINAAAKLPNGPRFVLYTGSMRSSGIPEELAQFKSFLKGFDIPVFGAIGTKDLFVGLDAGPAGGPANQTIGSGSNQYWKQVFADMPAPWGTAGAPRGIRPIPANSAQPLARTHYAFDVLEGSRAVLRVIVLDSSTKSLGNSSDQNPPNESQAAWWTLLAGEAKALGIPTVISMNQPTVIPDSIQVGNWQGQGAFEAPVFDSNAQAAGVTAVFAGGLRMNTTDKLPGRVGDVPLYVMGGGGAPLGFESDASKPTKLVTDGFYHGWHLVSLDPEPSQRNLLGQAPHTIRSFPTLESLAIRSFDGEQVAAGHTMRFSALGRGLLGGWSDKDQAKATYMHMGSDSLIDCRSFGQGDIYCQSKNAIKPGYRFWSEDPSIAKFVLPDRGRGSRFPALEPLTGAMLFDSTGQFGLLCTFKKGSVGINVESGFLRRRLVINVGPGDGPCLKAPVLDEPPDPRKPGVTPEVPGPEVGKPPVPKHTLIQDPISVVLPPAPGPVAAPAPPASAATSRKEEEEHQTQSEGQEGDGAEARAMLHAQSRPVYGDGLLYSALVAATVFGFLSAVVAGSIFNRRHRPAYAPHRIKPR